MAESDSTAPEMAGDAARTSPGANPGRPGWITALALVSFVGLLLSIGRDLFLPASRGVEVWLGFEVTGGLARWTAPIHWAIYAAGAWGFWNRSRWMWPAAALYVFSVALGHLIWSEVSVNGNGWPIGLAQAAVIGAIGVALWRARAVFRAEAAAPRS